MANVRAVYSVGNSIVTFLRNTYPESMPACGFELVSSGQLAGEIEETTRVTLYLYRVTVNEHGRGQRRSGSERAPLGLDLHYLLSAWAATPLDEQLTLAWAMRALHEAPVLDASSLSPEAGWARDEIVQVLPAELSTEDVMRIWDALDPAYRLSVSYVARVVVLDPDLDTAEYPRVVARRLSYGKEVVA